MNTVDAWVSGGGGRAEPAGERIQSFEALLRWCRVSGICDAAAADHLASVASGNEGDTVSVLDRSFRLRGALYHLFLSEVEGRSPQESDLDVLTQELRRSRRFERLVRESGRYDLEWRAPEPRLDGVLWPVVHSARSLLMDAEALRRLGRCPGERCGWLFLSARRGRRRRWCDMQDCGNVAKVRAFREREARA